MNLLIVAAAACLAQQTFSSVPPPPGMPPQRAEVQKEEAGIAAPVQWVGADSKHQPGFFFVDHAAAWRKLWAAHLGLAADAGEHGAYDRHFAPHVDFDRYVVVAYFRGPSTNRDGEVLKSIITTATRPERPAKQGITAADFYTPPAQPPQYTVLRFEPSTFQTASFNGADKGVATSPYGIWLIPLPPEPPARGIEYIIQEGRRSLKNEPVRYEEVAVLPGC